MKKYLLLFLLLTSCRSIQYQDINPTINPNPELLPALETRIDLYNLEATYSSGYFVADSDNSRSKSRSSFSGRRYKDERVSDTVNIFKKEVIENIATPYGPKKGAISLTLNYRDSEGSFIYPTASIFSGFVANFFGFPWNTVQDTLEVEVQILNSQNDVIRRYVETVQNSVFIAMWWSYGKNTANRKVAAENIKEALEKIRLQIQTDVTAIKAQLK